MSKDPYVYDDTNVLKNLANIKEQHKLDDYETTMVNLGIIKLLKSNIKKFGYLLIPKSTPFKK